MDLSLFVAVYLAFMLKHWLGDYALQNGWMVAGKGRLAPLMAHAGIHAGGTLIIALLAAPALWWLALIDLLLHAMIDRTKHLLSRGLLPSMPAYWRAFGADQALHQLTHLGFVLAIVLRG